jgi:type II restriction/modification system DNA methylase subunit YeeA
MTPEEFIDKWSRSDRTERQAAQEHFIDLCHVLGEPTPNEGDDPEAYSFEKGVSKTDGAPGFADVWKRGCFGWEYKKDRANLDRAYQQLQLYSVALESPPLLVVSDTKRFRIYTNWTNTVQEKRDFTLDDIAHSETRDLLRDVFRNPERLKPAKTREQVTKEAAKDFSTIAERLRMSGHPPDSVAHFLNRLVFCLFAEDVNLLQDDLFKRLLDTLSRRRDQVPERSQRMLSDLFREMRSGGEYGIEHILHFNGGLFDDEKALPLDSDSLDILRNIAKRDWSAIDPSIFGTLFERFLDPDKRAQIGAHYTDPQKILMIIEPVILQPLAAEWTAVKTELASILSIGRTRTGQPGKAALSKAEARLDLFLKRLAEVRVLDPACGSGNFLYLALQSLKDLEHRVIIEAIEMGLSYRVIHCGPQNVKGIEINRYAAELARTAIWIGNIQWLRRNGFEARKEPVLEDLDSIECRDALITPRPMESVGEKIETMQYVEADWPPAEFIVGNPPFLGAKLMKRKLGPEKTVIYRSVFSKRLAGFSDLVCFWFEKARSQILSGLSKRAGLVATSSIRGGTNRPVLDKIVHDLIIFSAWSEQPWVIEGARVEVSLICFSEQSKSMSLSLDGEGVKNINPDLTTGLNVSLAKRLSENRDVSFFGIQKSGPLDIHGKLARTFITEPANPNHRSNSTILRPYWNGDDLTGRNRDYWLIDFPLGLKEVEAALYEAPFEFLKTARYDPDNPEDTRTLVEARAGARDTHARRQWWEPYWPRPELRRKLATMSRYIATAETAEYRIFIWLKLPILPDKNLIVITRDDDTSFGILQSRFHEAWSLRLGTSLEDRPRYTSTTTFETFPFPKNLTLDIPAKNYADDPNAVAIARAARHLDEVRNAWLNPPDFVQIEPEIVSGYPDRVIPRDDAAAAVLRERTLTNLYNQRPQWLLDAHRVLDATVADAYGWPADISEEEVLAKLLELNLSRASAGKLEINSNDAQSDEDYAIDPSDDRPS